MGEGGFGAVYRGMQQDGTEIAVKAALSRKVETSGDELRKWEW